MRKCIATVSLSGALVDKLDAISAARFDAIEVFENDLINFPGTPAELRRMADDRGLGIDLYQPFRDLDARDRRRSSAAISTAPSASSTSCRRWARR